MLLGPQNIAARTFVQRANYFPIIPHPSMCQRQPAWKFPEMFALIIGVMGGPHFWESGSPGIFFRLGTQAALPRLRPVLARLGRLGVMVRVTTVMGGLGWVDSASN